MHIPFKVVVAKEELEGYVFRMEHCMWIWLGRGGIQSLGLSYYPHCSMLMDTPDTQNIFVKSITTRLAKIYPNKQLFFSTDLSSENPVFWQELIDVVKTELAKMDLEERVKTELAKMDSEDRVKTELAKMDLEGRVKTELAKMDLEGQVLENTEKCDRLNLNSNSSEETSSC